MCLNLPAKKEHERKGFEPMLADDQWKKQGFFSTNTSQALCVPLIGQGSWDARSAWSSRKENKQLYVKNETLGQDLMDKQRVN